LTTHTIHGINQLSPQGKRAIYSQVIPPELAVAFKLNPDFYDREGNDLLSINAEPGCSDVEMALYHQVGFPDPVFYGHIVDTINGQFHILLYILNDPNSPRFDVDRLPSGETTQLGASGRNLEAEIAAMQYGLAPGQVRRGLRLLGPAVRTFEKFVESQGHAYYFTEPLYYHNAILFERYGFSYEKGRKLMERIQQGLMPGGEYLPGLDRSTPFRNPQAVNSIRLRSWAIHDNILGVPFTDVTMYKQIGKDSGLNTCSGCMW
jgi:hypothetical protein